MTVAAVPLADLITAADSGFASGKRDPTGILQIRMNCVTTDGLLDISAALRVPPPENRLQHYLLKPGDVTFNATNSPKLVGKMALFAGHEEPVTFSNHFLRLRTDLDKLDPPYLAHWLTQQWRRRVFEGMCTQWVNQASIRKDRLLRLKIPLPLLAEQRRIAAMLDKADAIRWKRREAIGLLDDLLRSAFLEMFGDPVTNPKGWEVVRLGEVAEITTGSTPPRSQKDLYGDDIEWIKSDNINTPFHYVTTASERLSAKGRHVARLTVPDSILMTCIAGSRDCIGNVAMVDRVVSFNQQINAIEPEAGVDVRFMYTQFWTTKALVQRWSTNSMKGLVSKSSLEKTLIPFPPRDMQVRFGRWFDRWHRIRQLASRTVTYSDDLFNSLAQRAFGGEG